MAKRTRRQGTNRRGIPTPAEQFLYLLIEMENLIGKGPIRLTSDEAAALRVRLDRISRATHSFMGRE